jgi:hypothetical protein
VVTRYRRLGARPTGVVLIYRLVLVGADGLVSHQEAAVFLVRARHLPRLRSGRSLRAFATGWRPEQLPADAEVGELLRLRGERVLARILPLRRAAAQALRRRSDLLRVTSSSASRQLVQASLFDRRAVRQRARQDAANAMELFDLEHDPAGSERIGDLTLRAELDAVLVIEGSA